ncbi:hypothetical protein HPN88_28355 [Klebsiella pneumoniae]|nr:hypothetical protein [Klebsiella pneumoniae]
MAITETFQFSSSRSVLSRSKTGFTTLELTQQVMKLDDMDGLPQDKHVKAVKSVLYKLQKDGVVVKSKDDKGEIVWRWA